MSEHNLKIGLIGLDTSHVTAFAEILHSEAHPYHIPGGRIVAVYTSVSADFEMSYARVAEASDMILLESVDGRVHYEQFKRIAAYDKLVFIDKQLGCS